MKENKNKFTDFLVLFLNFGDVEIILVLLCDAMIH